MRSGNVLVDLHLVISEERADEINEEIELLVGEILDDWDHERRFGIVRVVETNVVGELFHDLVQVGILLCNEREEAHDWVIFAFFLALIVGIVLIRLRIVSRSV